MAYINGNQVNFSSYVLDENGYYKKGELKDQVEFAESERQKSQSKNLFNFYNCSAINLSQGDASIDYENKTITYTNATSSDQFGFIQKVFLKPNTTYTFSAKSTGIFDIYINVDGQYIGGGANTNYGSQSFTTGTDGSALIRLDNELGAGSTNVFSEFMLNEGDTALPYEDYYGEIIHEVNYKFNNAFPSETYQDLTSVTPYGASHRANADGYMIISGVINIQNGAVSLQITNHTNGMIEKKCVPAIHGQGITLIMPVRRNDLCSFYYGGIEFRNEEGWESYIRFYYAEGQVRG